MLRFVMVLDPREGWQEFMLPPQPAIRPENGPDDDPSEIYEDEIRQILNGPMLSLNSMVAPAVRGALSGLHLLINEEGMPRGLEPTAALDGGGNGNPRIIYGPVVAARARKGPVKGLRIASLQPGDEGILESFQWVRLLSGSDIEIGEDEQAVLLSLMPSAKNPTTYEGDFRKEVSFSPVVSDGPSFAAVHTMLRTFGGHVKACYFGALGRGAFKVYLVIEPEVSGPARRLWEEQP